MISLINQVKKWRIHLNFIFDKVLFTNLALFLQSDDCTNQCSDGQSLDKRGYFATMTEIFFDSSDEICSPNTGFNNCMDSIFFSVNHFVSYRLWQTAIHTGWSMFTRYV